MFFFFLAWFQGDKQNNTSMSKGARLAVKCADLAPHTWEMEQESVTVGGFVRSMAWDPLGERLAVIFKGWGISLFFDSYLPPGQYCVSVAHVG